MFQLHLPRPERGIFFAPKGVRLDGEALGDLEVSADCDVAIDIVAATGMVSQLSEEEFKALLLEAADQIGDTKIALDRKRARISAP